MPWLKPFLRDEKGAVTIEFVLWIPVFMALVAIVIDATSIYITQAEMWNVARDTARRMSSGLITCEDDAVQHVYDTIQLRDGAYEVTVAYNGTNGSTVVVELPMSDTAIIGIGSFLYQTLTLNGGTIGARVMMRHDPRITFDCGTGGGGGSGGGGGNGNGNGNV